MNNYKPEYFYNKFPHPSFRKGQKQAIKEIAEAFQQGYKYVVLDAPTGAGKSAINTAFARGFTSSFYTTPQNSLVDQIDEDPVISKYYGVVKGKDNYKCQNLTCKKYGEPDQHTAKYCVNNDSNAGTETEICCDASFIHRYLRQGEEDPPFKTADQLTRAIQRDSTCPYPKALWNALQSDNLLTNLFLFCVAPYLNKRDLAIIDESHNLEQVIFNFVDISITTDTVPFYGEISEELPKEDADKLEEFVTNDLKEMCQDRLQRLEEQKKQVTGSPGSDEDSSMIDNIEKKEKKIEDLLSKIKQVEELDEDFVIEKKKKSDRVDGVVLKPLYCGDFFQKKIAPKADKFLLSSATFGNAKKTLGMLGVDKSEIKIVSMKSQFPKENRPIHFTDVTSLKRSERSDGDFSKMAASILDIMNEHSNSKGIVHCISYDRQRYLKQALESLGASDRLITHQSSDGDEKLKEFKERDDNSVFLSVSKEEGIDLADDDARFNVLLKTPNPFAGDPRVDYRINVKKEWDWYFTQTAITTAQAYGRTTRSKDDWSEFYILDSYFRDFYKRNKGLLPDWFREAMG